MKVSKALFSTGEPAYAVDHSGVIVSWNPAAEQAFGYKEREAVGQQCWELLAGQDLFGNQYCCSGCPLQEMAFRHKSVKSSKIVFRTAANELKQFSVTTLVIYDGPGEELMVHLCRPECEVGEGCTTMNCAGQPTSNQERGNLTDREKEVLDLLSQGQSTQEMASTMCISTATVRNHTQHIIHKLNVHSRAAAVNLGQKLGLI
ncbi:MAG: LuxR C-terminal-related transcriptional regulator [Gammaproteobacteria bacterium]|nr:LuxR C-terminal-related transcriptional regulator [Gammaproteobacteria bacterium]MDH3767640.1 LuxR C-terminal-related transcriptional regulator [Gammaproteobacteria bacterium]